MGERMCVGDGREGGCTAWDVRRSLTGPHNGSYNWAQELLLLGNPYGSYSTKAEFARMPHIEYLSCGLCGLFEMHSWVSAI